MTRRALPLALLVLAACVTPAPAPPKTVRTIAVFPANNRTGDPLLISGGSILEKYVFHSTRVTVSDVLAAEARTLLERDGYTLVAPEAVDAATGGVRVPTSAANAAAMALAHDLDGDVLYIELRQWQSNVTTIIISMHIDLIAPASGKILWSADRPPRPLQTPGTINIEDAYWIAARAVIAEMLAPFAPGYEHR